MGFVGIQTGGSLELAGQSACPAPPLPTKKASSRDCERPYLKGIARVIDQPYPMPSLFSHTSPQNLLAEAGWVALSAVCKPRMLLRAGVPLTSNSQIPEKKPATDESLTGVPRQLLHDVQIWWVEAKCCGREAICHQVHPEQLHRDQGFGQAQNCCEEDTKTRVMGSSLSRPATSRGSSSTSHPRLEEGPSTASSAPQE